MERKWHIYCPGQSKEFSGKVPNVYNSKVLKLYKSYWSAHDLEYESEDRTLTLDEVYKRSGSIVTNPILFQEDKLV